MSIEKQVAQTIAQYEMLQPRQTVLTALSGGADSTALACVLQALGYSVRAYHLNHCLRGAESERDAAFVQRFCEKRHIPLTLESADAGAYAQQHHESVETAARRLRYERLTKCAAQFRINRIATAHTADDNLETMLFHLARGTGARGMAGIPPVRDAIVRPLWAVTRAELEAYLAGLGQDFVTDSSNFQLDYTRNRIRHLIVPALREINPSCTLAASRLAGQLRQDDAALCALAEQMLSQASTAQGIPVRALNDAQPAVQGRMLTALLRQADVPMSRVTARHISLLMDLLTPGGDRRCSLPDGFCAYREQDCLRIQHEPEREPIPVFDGFHGALWDTGTVLTIRRKKSDELFRKTRNTFLADCGTIHFGTLTVRTPAPGDRMILGADARGARQLKRILADLRIPLSQRAGLAVLADRNGVIAVQSVGIHQSRVPDAHSDKEKLEICFEGL